MEQIDDFSSIKQNSLTWFSQNMLGKDQRIDLQEF